MTTVFGLQNSPFDAEEDLFSKPDCINTEETVEKPDHWKCSITLLIVPSIVTVMSVLIQKASHALSKSIQQVCVCFCHATPTSDVDLWR